MHWHIFPRVDGDIPELGPVWKLDKSEMNSEQYRPNLEELDKLKKSLNYELNLLLHK